MLKIIALFEIIFLIVYEIQFVNTAPHHGNYGGGRRHAHNNEGGNFYISISIF
jgi:hypothetical protein